MNYRLVIKNPRENLDFLGGGTSNELLNFAAAWDVEWGTKTLPALIQFIMVPKTPDFARNRLEDGTIIEIYCMKEEQNV